MSNQVEVTAGKQDFLDVVRSLDIDPLPSTAEFDPKTEKVARIGEMVVASAAWGTYLSKEVVVSALDKNGLLTNNLSAQIDALGFDGGHYFPTDIDLLSPPVQQLQAEYAAGLALKAIGERRRIDASWQEIDWLIMASSTITSQVPGLVKQLVGLDEEHGGVKVKNVLHYSLACNSWSAALVDVLRNPDLKGKNVVIVGMDTLSGQMSGEDNPLTFLTFGNGGGAMALRPGGDMSLLFGEMVVEHDEKGIIKAPTIRPLPKEGRLAIPEGYKLVGDETHKHFVVTDEGVFMDYPVPETGRLISNGRRTLGYFAKNAPPALRDRVKQYHEDGWVDKYGPLAGSYGHQPSSGVVEAVDTKLVMLALEEAGLELGTKELKAIARLRGDNLYKVLDGYGVDRRDLMLLQWVMGGTRTNNISAGTGLVAITKMASEGLLLPGRAYIQLGLGIGNSYGVHAVVFGAL